MTALHRLFWLLVLGFHAVAAAGWWWLMPGGFPVSHPRFWSNGGAPVLVLGVVVAAVIAARRERWERLRFILALFPAAWAGAGLAARVVFPITFKWAFLIPLLGAALMGGGLALTFRRRPLGKRKGWPVWVASLAALCLGAIAPLAMRAPTPGTRPLNIQAPASEPGPPPPNGRLGPRLFVTPGDGSATVKAGRVSLSVKPLLRFISRSPDGGPSILAPASLREPRDLRLGSAVQKGDGLDLRYQADYEASLRIGPDIEGAPIVLEATARLARPINSHLNSFCDIEVSGHRRLSLSFSPCPNERVEVLPADYPVGRPLRFAYVDALNGFHVVEATSGEKGPFRELAGGPLTRSEPLVITFYDDGESVARLTLDDWTAQADATLSPTAGWGAPVNAIEFSLSGDAPGSVAGIYISLAGTSVGRGWDTVGHASGTYRNRVRVEPLGNRLPAPTESAGEL